MFYYVYLEDPPLLESSASVLGDQIMSVLVVPENVTFQALAAGSQG